MEGEGGREKTKCRRDRTRQRRVRERSSPAHRGREEEWWEMESG